MKAHSDWKARWVILWRSPEFLPYMLAGLIGVGSTWLIEVSLIASLGGALGLGLMVWSIRKVQQSRPK